MKPKVKVRVQFGPLRQAPPVTSTAPEPPRASRTAQLLALAWWLDEEIRAGRIENLAEAARELGLTRARLSQISDFRLLAPTIQAHILSAGMPNEVLPQLAASALRRLPRVPAWTNQLQAVAYSALNRKQLRNRHTHGHEVGVVCLQDSCDGEGS